MISIAQTKAMQEIYLAAKNSMCIFPDAQTCEAMLETTWLTSELGVKEFNLFGMKQHSHPIYGTINLPTKEYLDGKWVVQNDDFVLYPDYESSFHDRMNTLVTLAPHYPHYDAALKASSAEMFLIQVSLTWSTGFMRGPDCVSILHAHKELL